MSTARAHGVPRRRKASAAARLRPFWAIGIVLCALAVWGAIALVRAPVFRVHSVAVAVPIGSPVSRDAVRTAAAVPAGANVWLVDARGVARRIEAIPYVDRAIVRRAQFPAPSVDIAVTVRRATGCVRAGGRTVTIDDGARVLQDGCAANGLARVDAGRGTLAKPGAQIADPDVRRLLADAKTLADANLAVAAVRRDRWGGLEAVGRDGVLVRFGDDADLTRKTALVGPVRAGVGTRRTVLAIDLRTPATPTVEFR